MSYKTYEVRVYRSGTHEWYKDGKQHREDGPAFIYANGDQAWYKEGKLHREDGPAIVHTSGTEYWYRDGKLHREDGPAITYCDGYHLWYLNDVKLTEKEYLARTQPAKELTVAEIEKLLGYKVKVVGQD